ncbi:Meckel syndrome type 1 protein-like isoform X2 [Aphidius gifuensis]|uniref:Meckel syndrome type 1 protein-like isoform X2 n=1 Tax=Aphidius gifuensis TaxID=684658 RepID=UPI001CDBC93C|nr:Meckel syndrome type 1 protein-like isoform X2 [Aphidius gifuensis]
MGKINISADYRVDQSIANFKLRVKILQQKSLLAELFEGETRDSNFVECEDTIISWQEKIFSPYEIKLYHDISNCINDVQKKYHEEIISKNITKGSRLYTYTQNDYMFYKNKNPVTKEGFQSFLSLKNELALPSIMQNMKPFTERYNKRMISESPYDTWIRRNHYLYKNRVVMYVMVDLTSKDEAFHDMEDSEVLLCTVTFDKTRKILTIDPDLSFNKPYTIDKTFMNFDYWIEHVSCGQIPQEIQTQKKFLRHKIKKKNVIKATKIYPEIKQPLCNILRLYLTIDFTKVYGFSYDAMYLSYLIDLPKYWTTNQPGRLSGRSQRCRMSNDITWPQLLIAAASFDSWTRYRIEGYVSLRLFQMSGNCLLKLQTWRPVANFSSKLRRFFTGGIAELEDLTYIGIPEEYGNSILDKTHLQIMSSGTIEVNINVIQQCRHFSRSQDVTRETFDQFNAGILINNIESALKQFKIARERMIYARATS